ncbi:MAG: 3'-5' exonuclease [Campylobacterota bacterium]|nr:3'-5' exonuclease [Campylobacterota bacterium]
MNKMVIDFETNGFQGGSVLYCSVIIVDDNNDVLHQETRFYYPREAYSDGALAINGLSKEVVDRHRADISYPKYYDEDGWCVNLSKEYDVELLIAHNVEFDYSFLSQEFKSLRLKRFCTMQENTNFVGIRNQYGYKYPKLSEACKRYFIAFDSTQAHQSSYDTQKCLELYIATQNRLEKAS